MIDVKAKLITLRTELFSLGHYLVNETDDRDYEFMGVELMEMTLQLKEMQALLESKGRRDEARAQQATLKP